MKTRSRYRRLFTSTLLSALFISLLSSNSALAADTGYRYWGYFQAAPGATSWSMAQTGPTVNIPDGSVEGWAFTFSSDSVPDPATPRLSPNFARICGTTKAVPNKKRIGITIDFGNAIIKPKGESIPRSFSKCVVVEKNAIGLDVLAKVVKVRNSASGLVCGFNNYPLKECGAEIPTPKSLIPQK